MKEEQFLFIIEQKLKEYRAGDIDEILEEYKAHFAYKLADGFTEEEICEKLGDPLQLAELYQEDESAPVMPSSKWKIAGLIGLDIFAVQGFVLFAVWIISLFAFSLASLAIGASLFMNISPYGWIPYLPYWNGAVLGICFSSLFIFSLGGTYYFKLYLSQVTKKYIRFHQNVFARVKGKPTLPSLPGHVVQNRKNARILRTVLQLALNAFAISFVLGFLVSAITAKSFEFWHVYNWFV